MQCHQPSTGATQVAGARPGEPHPAAGAGSGSSSGHRTTPHLNSAVAISTLLTQGNVDKLLPVHQRAGKN